MTIKSDFKIATFDHKKTRSGDQPQENAKNTKEAAFFSAFFVFLVASSVVRFCSVSLGFQTGGGSSVVPVVARVFSPNFNCSHVYSPILTYSHIKNIIFFRTAPTQFPIHLGSIWLTSNSDKTDLNRP
jgi:hypothetical protein